MLETAFSQADLRTGTSQEKIHERNECWNGPHLGDRAFVHFELTLSYQYLQKDRVQINLKDGYVGGSMRIQIFFSIEFLAR